MNPSNLPPGVSDKDIEDAITEMPTFSYIRAWGQWRAYDSTDIELEVGLAIDNGAPEKALYYSNYLGHYITVDDEVITPMLRICLTNIAERFDADQD